MSPSVYKVMLPAMRTGSLLVNDLMVSMPTPCVVQAPEEAILSANSANRFMHGVGDCILQFDGGLHRGHREVRSARSKQPVLGSLV
jgi:hypothetical protein